MTPHKRCEYACPDGHYRHGTNESGNNCPACPGDMQTLGLDMARGIAMRRCINASYATECGALRCGRNKIRCFGSAEVSTSAS